MIIRVSFMVVASVAALTVSQIKASPPTKKNSKTKSAGSNVSSSEYEFGKRANSIANAIHKSEEEEETMTIMQHNHRKGDSREFELLISSDKPKNVAEMELLQNLVKKYKQNQCILERKLIKLKGWKEDQYAMAQLQRQLGNKTAELELLHAMIASLQAESKHLQEKIREGVLTEKQLHIAKRRINEMQKKNDVNGSPISVKEQLLILQQQVTEFRKYEDSGRTAMVKKKLKATKDVELEVWELKRRNKELELEKREVGMKLTTAQEKTVAEIREEISCLSRGNEELSEQVEKLQGNRFEMIQELVYQRWLCTCLKFEAINHNKKQSRKNSIEDCSQNSSTELCTRTRTPLSPSSDPELTSVSSNATLLESDENDTTTTDSSSSSQSSISSKNSGVLRRLKRWRKGENVSEYKTLSVSVSSQCNKSHNGDSPISHNNSLIPAFSMSMVSADCGDDDTVLQHDSSKSFESPKLKRVSFNDTVKPSTYYYTSEADEENEKPSNSNDHAGDIVAENKGSKNKIDRSEELETVFAKDDKVITQVVQLIASFFIVLFILLAFFRIK